VYEKTGEGKEELIDAAFKAMDAMELEGFAAEVLAGNYNQLTEAILRAKAAKAEDAVESSGRAGASTGSAFIAKLKSESDGGMYMTTGNDGEKYLSINIGQDGA
jgi:hypothetical protein